MYQLPHRDPTQERAQLVLLIVIVLLIAVIAPGARAVPLSSWPAWTAAQPSVSKMIAPSVLIARGSGTNAYYVLEVDPTTGALPVSGNIVASNPSVGPTGDPVPASATLVGGKTPGGNLQPLSITASGELNIGAIAGAVALPTGASTEATLATRASEATLATRASESTLSTLNGKVANDFGAASGGIRAAAQIGNASGAAAFGAGTTSAQTLRVVLPTDQTSIPAAQSGTWNINNISGAVSLPTGAATETTLGTRATESTLSTLSGKFTNGAGSGSAVGLRVIIASDSPIPNSPGRTMVFRTRLDYSVTSVTTSAYTELVSTVGGTNVAGLYIDDTSGQGMILAVGPVASESDRLYIPRGGFAGFVPFAIASGTRLSLKALTGNPTSGDIIINGFQL